MLNDTMILKKVFIPVILLVLAYEWLVSGIDKIISGSFVSSMHKQFIQAIPDMQYHFYADILNSLFAKDASLLAWAVELGELFAGISFLWLAICLIRNKLNPSALKLGIAAGIVSAFMNLNFFFYQGGFYFINPSDPFDEGIPVDLLMLLIECTVAIAFILIIRSRKKIAHTGS